MTHPLQLHKDYIPIEARIEIVEPPVQNKKKRKTHKHKPKETYKDAMKIGNDKQYFYSMQTRTPLQFRFIRFHGKGDLAAGYVCYKQYWDKLDKEAKEIIEKLGANKKKAAFARHIGIDSTILSHYATRKIPKKKYWKRVVTMRKIVKGFRTFKEKS